jgi:hypothetical protein
MIKFSESYGLKQQHNINGLARQPWLTNPIIHYKETNKMYSRISIALIVVGLLVAGYGIFNNSVTRAAPPCVTYNSATLAANPELLKIGCHEVTDEAEPNVQRSNEAYSDRHSDQTEFYTGAIGTIDSSYLAANPELSAVRRYNQAPVIEHNETSGSTFFAANPELMVVGRYTVPVIKHNEMSDSEFYAANPELMAVHRYAAAATER